jgi:endonuclease-8
LYGNTRNHRTPPLEPRGAVRLRVAGNNHAFDLNGVTSCEIINPVTRKSLARMAKRAQLQASSEPERYLHVAAVSGDVAKVSS